MFTGAFWGIFLVLIGVSILIRVFFNIEFPIFRIFFGLLFIALGINLVFGRHKVFSDSKNIIFGETSFNVRESHGKYNVVFSKGVTDLTSLPAKDESAKIEVNTVFGENIVYIKKIAPVKIRANSVFGHIELPDGNEIAFGTNHYTSAAFDKNTPHLQLELNTVFGSTRIAFRE